MTVHVCGGFMTLHVGFLKTWLECTYVCSSVCVLSKSTMYYVVECIGNLLHCCTSF